MSPKRVLVTGAAGFIGSHVTEALLSRGDAVVGLDNFDPYYDPARKRANLAEVGQHPAASQLFEFHEGDIRDEEGLDRLFAGGIDAVVHLAAMAGVGASMRQAAKYIDVNVQGTRAILDAMERHGTRQCVFASTSSAYGLKGRVPFSEDDPADTPLAPYPASKRAAELLGHSYHHMFGLDFTAVRFFTVYGPRGRPDMMTYKVVDSMVSGREVPLYGDGQAARDWTFVRDITDGVLLAVDTPLGYEIVNLGRGEPVLLSEYIAALEKCTGTAANLVPTPMPPTDMLRTHARIDKARRLLGYSPKVSVEQGVAEVWAWHERAVLGR